VVKFSQVPVAVPVIQVNHNDEPGPQINADNDHQEEQEHPQALQEQAQQPQLQAQEHEPQAAVAVVPVVAVPLKNVQLTISFSPYNGRKEAAILDSTVNEDLNKDPKTMGRYSCGSGLFGLDTCTGT